MTKRWYVTVVLVIFATSMMFSEVKIKPIDGTAVEITFLFKHPASEMNVIGNFDNWTVPGEAMTKNADGVWEYKLQALNTDEILYKFFTKDVWIYDSMAPDKKDDGFGGNNGLIVVADVLSGETILPSSDAPAVDAPKVDVKNVKSKLYFGTNTVIGSKTTFSTQELVDKTNKGLEVDDTGFYAKTGINFNGTIVPNMSVFLDMHIFEGYKKIWAQDSRGNTEVNANDGFRDLFYGLTTNPMHYMNDGDANLKALKTGIETPWFNWETGYGEARSRKRDALLWTTLNDRNGDDGYSRFELGEQLQYVGDGKLNAGLLPNRFGGELGLASWMSYELGNQAVDFQYDVKSNQTTEIFNFFEKLYHQDILLGYKIRVDALEIKAHSLVNVYSEDDFDFAQDTALGIQGVYDVDGNGALLGYQYTGDRANMLYGDNDGSLIRQANQTIKVNAFVRINEIKGGFDSDVKIANHGLSETDIEFYVKPWAEYNLANLIGRPSSINAYTKINYNLKENYKYAASDSSFLLGEAGLKWYLSEPFYGITKGMDVYYGFNNWDSARIFHSLVSSISMQHDLTALIGTGIRVVRDNQIQKMKDENNLIGFALGGSWKIPAPKLKTPLLYGAFVYNMDPFGEGTLAMSDYVTDGGADKMNGKAQLRIMMKWDF